MCSVHRTSLAADNTGKPLAIRWIYKPIQLSHRPSLISYHDWTKQNTVYRTHLSGTFLRVQNTNVEQNTAFLKRNRLLTRPCTTKWIIPTEIFSQTNHLSFELRQTCSRLFKVTDFGTNGKHVCDFLLVRHRNVGPILHCFRDTAGFLLMTSPLFHPNFGVFPLDQIAEVGVSPSQNLKYSVVILLLKYSKNSNLCDQRTWMDGHGQTNGWTT